MKELAIIKNLIKPELVIISETPKLRAFPLEELKARTVDLVGDLLSLLGVSEGKTEHHNALTMHIVENYTHVTFEQIKKAFGMFVKGEFKVKPFQQLNAVVFGQVMTEFDSYQKEQTRVYRLKMQEFKNKAVPMTQQEKDVLMRQAVKEAFEAFKIGGTIEMASGKYDWLDGKGILQGKRSDDDWNAYKKTKYVSVQTRLQAHFKTVKSRSKDHRCELKHIVNELQEQKSGKVISQCKLEILEDYFKTLKNGN